MDLGDKAVEKSWAGVGLKSFVVMANKQYVCAGEQGGCVTRVENMVWTMGKPDKINSWWRLE